MDIKLKKGKLSPFDLEMTENAIHFYLQQLLPNNPELFGADLKIHLEIRKKPLVANQEAVVEHDVVFDFSTIFDCKQDTFKLSIVKNENISSQQYLTVLAHECVHIKQALLKELKFYAEVETMQTIIVWRNRVMSDLSGVKHKHLPWEVEAFAKQGPLSEKFILHYAEVIRRKKCTS